MEAIQSSTYATNLVGSGVEANTYSRIPCRMQVSDRHYQLWHSRSVKDLTIAWFNCVQGHDRAWSSIGCLYAQLLSDTTLLVQYSGYENVKGVLVDWEHSAENEGSGHVPQVSYPQAEPFLAIDILYDRPWGYLYRYGLESFVYILVWAAVHYDLKNKKRADNVHPTLRCWVAGGMQDRGNAKDHYVNSPGSLTREGIEDAIKQEFKTVLDDYITALLYLLSDAYASKVKLQRAKIPPTEYDYNICGGAITFEKFAEKIGKTARWDEDEGIEGSDA